MADSFFGFDTSIPLDDDGGGNDRDEEDEYDALNDETFGAAINGDWEDLHENLVQLDKADIYKSPQSSNSKSREQLKYFDNDNDLELSLSRVGLEDLDVSQDDPEGRLMLDPSVWSSPAKSLIPQRNNTRDLYGLYGNPEIFLRQNFSQPFNNFPSASNTNVEKNENVGQQKIVSLEDLERSILLNQRRNVAASPSLGNHHHQMPPGYIMPQMQNLQPPGMPQFPSSAQQQNSQPPQNATFNRLPPGFSPMHLMNNNQGGGGGGMLGNGQQQQQHPPNGRHNMAIPPPNMPMPPMMGHPPPPSGMQQGNFSPIRPPPNLQNQQQQQQHQMLQNRIPPHPLVSPFFQQNVQNLHSSVNQFNQRLVQEIQQNHPLLAQLNRMNNNYGGGGGVPNNLGHNNNNNNNGNGLNQKMPSNSGNHQQQQQQHQGGGSGNYRRDANLNDFDEYANLMSTRDKQWLIGIQLMQLNTETPYIDDFYYTVYKERQKSKKGDYESKAHKDNQLNHPFTQPKLNHAHLLMMFGKNGMNQRNGHHNRERKNSESNSSNKQNSGDKDQQQPHRTYTPLQFENSLGKLQCGSVTAPRKIIDMDIVGPELSNALNNSSTEISVQRRSRQLLLHIETLYRIVLKMEDLQNPVAIAAAKKLKEKKEKERLQQLAAGTSFNTLTSESVTIENSLKAMDEKNAADEPETFGELLQKLLAGLTNDKVVMMMSVRKGKVLLRRIMSLIHEQKQKWDIWCAIISTIPNIVRKHSEDSDGLLLGFYPELRNHIQFAGIVEILRLAAALTANNNDKKLSYVIESKFCILLIIAMILRVERFYSISVELVGAEQEATWIRFLNAVTNCSTNVSGKDPSQTTVVASDNEVIKTLVEHFSRFDKVNSSQLIVVLTQN